ncbi:hypothetical protein HF086_006417 [Spodoptera exigua]|uniref:Uncharacterized protein n=1 Tax=Spodoptera exigua TaxID=7107 RepID=A0A922SP24_SPOEX|nr:hypothetical protein HF086_006417 [Spodoptera exigua]
MLSVYKTQDTMVESKIPTLYLSIWLIKTQILSNMLSSNFEKFYVAMKNVQDSCAYISKSNCSDDLKKWCKNVLRLYRVGFSKMSVCGMFYVDFPLLWKLQSLMSQYIIIIVLLLISTVDMEKMSNANK